MPYKHLTQNNRVELAALIRAGHNQADIARVLGKNKSTIGRELERNIGNDGAYRPGEAEKKTKKRRELANQRFKKITRNKFLTKHIEEKIKQYWSPEQIAGRLRKENGKILICHETIYSYIYNERPDLKQYLRCRKGKYRRRYGTKIRENRREQAKLAERRIDKRPDTINKRRRIGDWEGDTIVGLEKTKHILTHAERKSGYLLADKLERATSEETRHKTVARFKKLPKQKRFSCTYDNGSAFAEYELTEKSIGMKIYFAYPYHSWERGTNENTNGLLRQFFPKKTKFENITQKELDRIVKLINTRPRKRLNYSTPEEVFNNRCALD